MLLFIEVKLVRLTHDVPNLRMERIPIGMQEHVVGLSSFSLHLLQKVSNIVLYYQEVVAKEVAIDEDEEPP